jgi:hypothetical protein
MCLSRFVVTSSFAAWSPGDRAYPEKRVCITPSPKDLFTDDVEKEGFFVKFLRNGSWYEATRCDFAAATKRQETAVLTSRLGA